ncbi:translation initiation factor IF-2-like [Leguminivora glycinivorella]|uniref:translation initiation factor IF-2-like n=1 Tax=Leguminivora glycinivorella TaxID=1035111 RepID=UPI00200F10FC|nr:translation initiation factor IF-2-like [Leguminivora glycinivorella]
MGKRKRSRDEDYSNILRKVKKLEAKLRRRRRSFSTSSESDYEHRRYYEMDNMDIQGDEIIDLDEVGVHSQPTHNEIDYAAPYPPPPSPSSAQPASFAERVPSAHAAPAPAPLAQAAPPGALSAPTVPPQSEPCALSALAECSAPPVTSAPPMQDDVPTAPSAPSNVMYNQTPNINCTSKINTDEALTDEYVPSLDPEILQLLGDDPTTEKNTVLICIRILPQDGHIYILMVCLKRSNWSLQKIICRQKIAQILLPLNLIPKLKQLFLK